MTAANKPVHLNNHHRGTLNKIFQHPVNHNVEWNDVLSLLNAVATVEEKHDGKYSVTLGDVTETIERPKHKDVGAQEVLDLRRLLSAVGFAPE
jgi:thiamine biosynthesis lipoprotein ApbE